METVQLQVSFTVVLGSILAVLSHKNMRGHDHLSPSEVLARKAEVSAALAWIFTECDVLSFRSMDTQKGPNLWQVTGKVTVSGKVSTSILPHIGALLAKYAAVYCGAAVYYGRTILRLNQCLV